MRTLLNTFVEDTLGGNRSGAGCSRLKKAGFQQVFNLHGGMRSWSEAGLPLAKK